MPNRDYASELNMTQKIHTSKTGSMPYCARLFSSGKKQRPSALLFLHGAGERGFDNSIQLVHAARELVDFCDNSRRDALLLFPQCPPEKMWIEAPWNLPEHTMTPEPTSRLALAFEILDSEIKAHDCDPDRIIVAGISMGGFGTWDALARRPGFFAAAIPVCGGGDVAQAPKMTGAYIHAYHGSIDSVVMVKRSRDMFAAVKAAGGEKIDYTEFPGCDHNSWDRAFADKQMLAKAFGTVRGH